MPPRTPHRGGRRPPSTISAGRLVATLVLNAALAATVLATVEAPVAARTDPIPVAVGGTDLGSMHVRPQGTLAAGTTVTGLWSSTRDCGMTTRLSTGRTLWVWCDSTLFDEALVQTGVAVTNSAALGATDTPTVVEDVLVDGKLTALVPAQTHFPCAGFRAAWPHGVVTLPDVDGRVTTDRVAVWFENICHYPQAGGGWAYEQHGVGVAVLDVDLSLGPRPLQARVLRADLFPADPLLEHQFGAVLGPPPTFDQVHLYACESEGSCSVRRVAVGTNAAADEARLVDPAAYESWDGTAWGPGTAALAPVIIGSGPTRLSGTGVSVAWVPRQQRYVAAYMPWPGINRQGVIITARRPEGPWSAPVLVDLPSCGTVARCYALNVHTHVGAPDGIGLSYLRSLDFFGTKQGTSRWFARAHLATVPLGSARPACATANGVRFDAEVQLGSAAYRWRRSDGSWWPWLVLPGGPWTGQPALVGVPGGGLDLLVLDADGDLWRFVRTDGSGFGAPERLTTGLRAGGEMAATAQAGGVEVFLLDEDGVLRRLWLPWGGGASGPSPVLGMPAPATAVDVAPTPDGGVVLGLVGADGSVYARRRGPTGWTVLPSPVTRAWALGGVAVEVTETGDPVVTTIDVGHRPIVTSWPEGSAVVRATGSYAAVGDGLTGCRDPDGRAVVVGTAPDLLEGRQATAAVAGEPSSLGPMGVR